jgi:hypothetical protein
MICRFRWAACQLKILAGCITPGKVRRALKELPKTLDATYARILCAIDTGEHAEEALKILTWLTYAERPMTAIEALQVTGIVIEDAHRFDEDEVLIDSNDVLRLCSSFVSIATDADSNVTYVRLAHFSVKEFLVSSRPCIPRYRLTGQEPHDMLAKCCLVYLLRFRGDEWRNPDCESVFPLARYAAKYWTRHARASGMLSEEQKRLSVELFTQNTTSYIAWVRFFNVDRPRDSTPYIRRELHHMPTPLYIASREGIANAVIAILSAGADVNAEGGEYGTALQAAVVRGHKEVVQMLLEARADVNAKGGEYGTALQVAVRKGYTEVVQILLKAGADVNPKGGEYGTNVPPRVPRLPCGETLFFSRLLTPPVHAGIGISTISCCSPALCPPGDPYAMISCARQTLLSTNPSLLSIFLSTSRLACRRSGVPVRSKQGALGSLWRADHPRPACMLSVAVGGRCVAVVSARRAVSRDSFRLH